jgi:hypothetical protein
LPATRDGGVTTVSEEIGGDPGRLHRRSGTDG